MKTAPLRTLILAVGGTLMLAACSQQTTRQNTANSSATARQAKSSYAPHHRTLMAAPLPTHTGIPACDNYLSTYLACHRAAGIFAPDQLQSRYEMMRTSLLRDSQNPDIRPQLVNRCTSLASELHDALHGKSCDAAPAAAGSAP